MRLYFSVRHDVEVMSETRSVGEQHLVFCILRQRTMNIFVITRHSFFFSFSLSLLSCWRRFCLRRLGVPQCVPALPRSDSVCCLAGGSLWRLWMVSTQAGEFTQIHKGTPVLLSIMVNIYKYIYAG